MIDFPFRAKLSDHLSLASQVLDSLGSSLIGWICYWIYVRKFPLPTDYVNIFIINSFLVLVIFPYFSIYYSWRGRNKWNRIFACAYAWSFCLITLVLLLFLMKTTAVYSRFWFFLWWLSGTIYLVAYRTVFDLLLKRLRAQGLNHKKVIIYGAGKVGLNIAKRMQEHPEIGFNIIAFIDDNLDIHGKKLMNILVHPREDLLKMCEGANELWLALPFNAHNVIDKVLHDTRHSTLIIKLIPDIFGFRLLNHSISELAGYPIIDINGSPLSTNHLLLKRIEDVVLSIFFLIILSPLMILIAVLIKLTSQGPILYKQKRHGWGKRPINVYKFRSMYYKKNDSFKQAQRNDSRITPLGRILRRTSVDELPQFFNVLQGRMSIVGPRPHAISMNEDYKDKIDRYMQRHKVKPGITGWAQVNGFRGETDTIDKMERRIECDLYYIQNWSLIFDFKIIFLTILKGLVNRNAY